MANTKLINVDQLQSSLSRTKTYIDTQLGNYYNKTTVDAAHKVFSDHITAANTALAGKSDSGHKHASNDINAMTGYSKPANTSAIAASDTLNQAIGKLEKAIESKQGSGSYAPAVHDHNDKYYTEAEIDTKVSNINTSISTNLASAKSYADGLINKLVNAAPATLDTLNELADALGNDENFAATMASQLASKSDEGHGHDAATTTADGFMTSTMVTKLNGIATSANNYSHPTTEGNKHIPKGGSSGQFLGYSAAGTAQWVDNPNTDTKVTSNVTTTATKTYLVGTSTATNTTGTLLKDTAIYMNVTSGELCATKFTGSFNGKATSAGTADSATSATSANKVANSLSIQLNGGTATTFNGSGAKSINITPSSIGAATSASVTQATDSEINTMLTTVFGE